MRSPATTSTRPRRCAWASSTRWCRPPSCYRARALAERIAKVPEPSVRLNKAVTCYGLLAMGLGAGMLMNVPFSSMAHASYNAHRAELIAAMQSGGLKAFLEARDGGFRPEPFGPKSAPKS